MITACMLAKNEESNISSSINRLKDYVDEIIIVDNASSDNTAQIAVDLGCKVINCSDKTLDTCRNLYLRNAKKGWVLLLDVDEMILPSDLLKLRKISETDTDKAAYNINRFDYLGNGKWAYTSLIKFCRLTDELSYNDCMIHGSLMDSLNNNNYIFKECDISIHHLDFKYRNLDQFGQKRKLYVDMLLKEISNQKYSNDFQSFLHTMLGLEYFAISDQKQARKELEYSISMVDEPCAFAYFCIANLDILEEKYENINFWSKKLIQTGDPYYIDKGLYLSTVYELKYGNHKNAINLIKKAIKLNPDYAHNYYNLSKMLQSTGLEEDYYYATALKLNPLLNEKKLFDKFQHNSCFTLQNMVIELPEDYCNE